MPPPELPAGYYLSSFYIILDQVGTEYRDLLSENEQAFSREFRALTTDAQRLYVRLIMRKGPVFRDDKLSYRDIACVPRAAGELAERGFLEIDGEVDTRSLLALLTKPELVLLPGIQSSVRAGDRRDTIVARIEQHCEVAAVQTYVHTLFAVYFPLRLEELELFRLLFFGNLNQDLTEFVVLDLGLYQYEDYVCDVRRFDSRQQIETTYRILNLDNTCKQVLAEGDHDALAQVFSSLPQQLDDQDLLRRRDRIVNRIARYFERNGDQARALQLYQNAERPPARERSARILHRLGREHEALEVCAEISADPWTEHEKEFAAQFSARLSRRLTKHTRHNSSAIPTQIASLAADPARRVEELALTHLSSVGTGFYSGNYLWQSFFGLAFWDIIFMPMPGAFTNRYQRGPHGLYTPEFRRQRRQAVEERLAHIGNSKGRQRTLRHTLKERFETKHGIANQLVDWRRVTWQQLEMCLERMPCEHIVAIFDRLSRDLRENKTGFPDLIVFPTQGGYQLVEVKSPGDQLQLNQKRWIRYFGEHHIPFVVLRVEWQS